MIAGQLWVQIRDTEESIRNDLKAKVKDKPSDEQAPTFPKKKKKTIDTANKPPPKQEQFLYDLNDPKYCSCNGGSFGEMVGCENPYCER